MPILLWIVYPFAIWSACVAQTVPVLAQAVSHEDLTRKLTRSNE